MIEIILSVSSLALSCYACFINRKQQIGPQGPQGPQGIMGPQGPQGLQVVEKSQPALEARSRSFRSNPKSDVKFEFKTKDERRKMIAERALDLETQKQSVNLRKRLQDGSGLIAPHPDAQRNQPFWRTTQKVEEEHGKQ